MGILGQEPEQTQETGNVNQKLGSKMMAHVKAHWTRYAVGTLALGIGAGLLYIGANAALNSYKNKIKTEMRKENDKILQAETEKINKKTTELTTELTIQKELTNNATAQITNKIALLKRNTDKKFKNYSTHDELVSKISSAIAVYNQMHKDEFHEGIDITGVEFGPKRKWYKPNTWRKRTIHVDMTQPSAEKKSDTTATPNPEAKKESEWKFFPGTK